MGSSDRRLLTVLLSLLFSKDQQIVRVKKYALANGKLETMSLVGIQSKTKPLCSIACYEIIKLFTYHIK